MADVSEASPMQAVHTLAFAPVRFGLPWSIQMHLFMSKNYLPETVRKSRTSFHLTRVLQAKWNEVLGAHPKWFG